MAEQHGSARRRTPLRAGPAGGRVPDLVPVLSRGKHRNPRKGACFMELVSYLAGEPWSDHPACTHPLLAALARDVNDHLGDGARPRIAPMAAEVVGLDSRDPAIDVLLARGVALTALRLAPSDRQGVAAVGVLHCEHVLNELHGRPFGHLSGRAEEGLAAAPHAHAWAVDFCSLGFGRADTFGRRSAPHIVHSAVVGVAHTTVDDPDDALVDLLRRSIADCRTWMAAPRVGRSRPPVDTPEGRPPFA